MSREPIRITREELHRLVWSKTMRRVAEELGTSYVELVKACTAMDVPRPVSGQWKSLMLGQVVDQVPLPEKQSGVAVEFLLRPIETFSEEELPPLPDGPQAEEAEAVTDETGAQIVETAVNSVRKKCAVAVTRQELYEKVWQIPLKRLANEWGTSYVQLVAASEAMNVPRPPGGHWVRLSLGLPVEKIQLPEAGPGTPTEVTLQPQLSRAERAAKSAEKRQAKARAAKVSGSSGVEDVTPNGGSGEQSEHTGVEPQAAQQTANLQHVGKRLESGRVKLPMEGGELHPIAQRHVQALQKAKPGELGFVSVRGPDLFWCDMTPALVPRFGQAVHALVCELEQQGYRFQEGEDDGAGLGIVRDGDRVDVRWSEGRLIWNGNQRTWISEGRVGPGT